MALSHPAHQRVTHTVGLLTQNEHGKSVMKYPEYDRNRYEVWALPHLLVLHWILNPGLVFNELLFGQRIPKVTLIDKTLDKPLMERSLIPCPSCGELHDGRFWANKNAFGHWFGYVCPSCGEIIPCLWNLTSLLILTVTSPLWYFPVKLWKRKWIEFEKSRYNNTTTEYTTHEKTPWIKMGILYGGLMGLILGLAFQVLNFVVWKRFDWQFLLYTALLWMIAGFLFAVIMYLWLGLRPKRKMQDGQKQ